MRRRVILKGSHGEEYVLTPFVGATVVDRACALAPQEARHALQFVMWQDRNSLRLRRPEILSVLEHSSFDARRLSDEALHQQLLDEIARPGRLLLVRDHEDAPWCGTDTRSRHSAEHQVEPKKPKDESRWGGDSARWPQERKLESMHPNLRPRVEGVVKGLAARGFQPLIFYGWRSVKVQQEKLKSGYSHVKFSFHNATNGDGTPCAYAADIEQVAAVSSCRKPRWTTAAALVCNSESVGSDGRIKVKAKKISVGR